METWSDWKKTPWRVLGRLDVEKDLKIQNTNTKKKQKIQKIQIQNTKNTNTKNTNTKNTNTKNGERWVGGMWRKT